MRIESIADIPIIDTDKVSLIKGVLMPRQFVLVVSAPKQSKTFMVLQMGAHMLLQKPLFGADTQNVSSVLYITGEGQSGVGKRFRALQAFHDDPLDGFMIIRDDDKELCIYDSHSVANLIQLITSHTYGLNPDVIIIDTLHSVSNGIDDGLNTNIALLTRNIKTLIDTLGCTVILVHHTTKNGTNYRGGGALAGDIDVMMSIVDGQLSIPLIKDFESPDPVRIGLMSVNDSAVAVFGDGLPLPEKIDPTTETVYQIVDILRATPDIKDLTIVKRAFNNKAKRCTPPQKELIDRARRIVFEQDGVTPDLLRMIEARDSDSNEFGDNILSALGAAIMRVDDDDYEQTDMFGGDGSYGDTGYEGIDEDVS